jgi:hypothetical protein
MDGLGIERPHTICIGGEMPKRRMSDDIESFPGRHFRTKLDGLGMGSCLVIAVRQPIPAFGFGSQIKLAAGSTLAVSGQSEKVSRPTPLELEFELRDRAAAPTGRHVTAINGQFHLARSDMDGPDDAVD